jgi:hypothetical protein
MAEEAKGKSTIAAGSYSRNTKESGTPSETGENSGLPAKSDEATEESLGMENRQLITPIRKAGGKSICSRLPISSPQSGMPQRKARGWQLRRRKDCSVEGGVGLDWLLLTHPKEHKTIDARMEMVVIALEKLTDGMQQIKIRMDMENERR